MSLSLLEFTVNGKNSSSRESNIFLEITTYKKGDKYFHGKERCFGDVSIYETNPENIFIENEENNKYTKLL